MNRLYYRWESLQSVIEGGEWMRAEKRRVMPINRCVFVIEPDVTGLEARMIGILIKAEHQVPI